MTHWVVDTEASSSRESVSMATLTIVVSNMTIIAPVMRMMASFTKARSNPSCSAGFSHRATARGHVWRCLDLSTG